MEICFLHGLESSPQGTKARRLQRRYPHCRIPVLPPDLDERLAILADMRLEPGLIIGSSLGGLTALMHAMRYPARVRGLVLLAPAVGYREPGPHRDAEQKIRQTVYIPQGIPAAVIAGLRDELIPPAAVRALVERSPEPSQIKLVEVEDDHRLRKSLDLMLRLTEEVRMTCCDERA